METEFTSILVFHKTPPLLLSQKNPYRLYNDAVNQQIQPDRICFIIY